MGSISTSPGTLWVSSNPVSSFFPNSVAFFELTCKSSNCHRGRSRAGRSSSGFLGATVVGQIVICGISNEGREGGVGGYTQSRSRVDASVEEALGSQEESLSCSKEDMSSSSIEVSGVGNWGMSRSA